MSANEQILCDRPSVLPGIVLVGMLVASGCFGQGYRIGEVTGTVTMAGKPVPSILVEFAPPGGSSRGLPVALGLTDASGRYRLVRPKNKPGAVVGLNNVRLSITEGDAGKPIGVTERDLSGRELSFDVKTGSNVFDIALDR